MREKESEDAAHLLLARRCDIAVVVPGEQPRPRTTRGSRGGPYSTSPGRAALTIGSPGGGARLRYVGRTRK